ncbi:MAG: DUF89 family protein [Candidatus Thorarchaeota archaeon]|nr:DUF89 family protein [Candidatus Thorarchaeota archaeon]
MKVTIHCAHCLLKRALNQASLATDDPEKQMQVIAAITSLLGDQLTPDSVPSHIGTERDLLVQRITGKDPYRDLKRQSNEAALLLVPELERMLASVVEGRKRFRTATLVAAAANSIEFDVSGRDFSLEDLKCLIDSVEADLAIDQVDEFYDLCTRVKDVLYLLDNAGELVFDMFLIREIRRAGPRVTAVVKGGAVLNDATVEDAESVKLSSCADSVISTGAAAIGVNLERSSDEFREAFYSSQLIVAKGMGNYESLTEFRPPSPTVHIMRTKCPPVASHVGVPLNKNVVLIRLP